MLHIKFGFDWQSGFREKIFEKCVKSTGFIHLTVSEEKIFECFFQNFALYGAPATNQNKGLGQTSQETSNTTQ